MSAGGSTLSPWPRHRLAYGEAFHNDPQFLRPDSRLIPQIRLHLFLAYLLFMFHANVIKYIYIYIYIQGVLKVT